MIFTNDAVWERVFEHLHQSVYAEQVFCSIVTQMEFLPSFQDQPSLKTVHKENYETSYHRNTAVGNVRRLLVGKEHEQLLILMTVECFIDARKHDKQAEAALGEITAAEPYELELLSRAQQFHHERKYQLRCAAKVLRHAIGPELWEKGAALAT